MFQRVIAAGNLGQDPVIKYTPSGTAVANFSIAVDESYKDKAGNQQKKTEWINVVAWERQAELAGEYLKKGSSVLIEGKLSTRSWEDKTSGEKKYKTEVVASTIKFLDKKTEKPTTAFSQEVEDDSLPF
jgi:single-strand DNA-binding protein